MRTSSKLLKFAVIAVLGLLTVTTSNPSSLIDGFATGSGTCTADEKSISGIGPNNSGGMRTTVSNPNMGYNIVIVNKNGPITTNTVDGTISIPATESIQLGFSNMAVADIAYLGYLLYAEQGSDSTVRLGKFTTSTDLPRSTITTLPLACAKTGSTITHSDRTPKSPFNPETHTGYSFTYTPPADYRGAIVFKAALMHGLTDAGQRNYQLLNQTIIITDPITAAPTSAPTASPIEETNNPTAEPVDNNNTPPINTNTINSSSAPPHPFNSLNMLIGTAAGLLVTAAAFVF